MLIFATALLSFTPVSHCKFSNHSITALTSKPFWNSVLTYSNNTSAVVSKIICDDTTNNANTYLNPGSGIFSQPIADQNQIDVKISGNI